ncbi:MAG TPA: hypothetical protein VGR73_16750 [Bryobacteraceae bacterium]|nr:hypothetical protein [Bryobacteraceae bacterium]
MRKLLLAGLFALPIFAPLLAADLTKIKVVVTNEAGKPVDRADVVVKFVEGRSIVKLGKKIRTSWEMHTSQEGAVDIPEIPKGKILVQIIAKNYQTFGQTYDVGEDERTIEIKLNPPQSQYTAH